MNERIPVLYGATLKPEWVDFALENSMKINDNKELKNIVKEYLSIEIESDTSLRKTISQLQQTVGPTSPIPRDVILNIYNQMQQLAPSQRKIHRLKLLIEANPFVKDVLKTIYKITVLGVQGIKANQLYERLIEKYGDRETIPRRVRYALATLSNFGLLENQNRKWYVIDNQLLEACVNYNNYQ